VRFIHQAEDVILYLIEKAQSGGCAFWIRNTVRDAVEAYELLREKAPHIRVILFHARFIGYDRNAIEKKVLETFGKTSTSEIRRQTILIATQVVEQSLDLDCDWMVSDIAPIDLLIQRLGRMRRHSRDKDGNRINGADQRSGAELVVFAPEWIDNPDSQWLSAPFQGSKAVYTSLPLYRTMAELRKKMVIRIPTDSRELIEKVFGEGKITPDDLLNEEIHTEGNQNASRTLANASKLTVKGGYSAASLWDERESIGTREGQPTVAVRLLIYNNKRYIPLAEHNALSDQKSISKFTSWELSDVRVRSNFVQQDSLPESFDDKILSSIKENMPDKGKSCYIIVLQEKENCEGVILGTDGVNRRVIYSRSVGLTIK
jgi:CRISPR-associated endonuclease/helicase Cas3